MPKLRVKSQVDVVPAIKEVLSKFSLPETLVMDNEKSFGIGELKNYYNANSINIYKAAVGRSEINGIVERFHSTVLEIYRITKTEHPNTNTVELMQMSVNKYNNSIHSITLRKDLQYHK